MAAHNAEVDMADEYDSSNAFIPVQPIDAHYYNVVDHSDRPIGGLVVLLDRRKQPARAELHLYEDLTDPQTDFAFKQAKGLVAQRYYGDDQVAITVMQSYPWRDTLQVQPQALAASAGSQIDWMRYWPAALGAAALLLLVALIWAASAFFRGDDTLGATSAPAAAEQPTAVTAQAAPQNSNPGGPAVQTNNLPASVNAHPELAIGKRVRVRGDLRASLVSEPGNNQEKVVGYLEPGQEASITNGPVYTQGAKDTIVWWYIKLNNGLEAWAPANTSEFTVLEPVQ